MKAKHLLACLSIFYFGSMQAQTQNSFGGTAPGGASASPSISATGYGADALKSLTTGPGNTAVGNSALSSNLIGDFNTAVGKDALKAFTGIQNTAFGALALRTVVSESGNTAVGFAALSNGTVATPTGVMSGTGNTAVGLQSLTTNTTGNRNAALGNSTLYNNTTGNDNVSIGTSLFWNTTGSNNIAIGYQTSHFVNGSSNIALGYESLRGVAVSTNYGNISLGNWAGRETSGNNNIFLGNNAGRSVVGSNNLILGSIPGGTYNNTIILGTPLQMGNGTGAIRLFIDGLGNAGLGTSDATPGNKLEIKSAFETGNGASGLRLTNLTSGDNASFTSNGKVLTVNANGDVVLTNDQSAAGGNMYVQVSPLNTNLVLTGNGSSATPYILLGKNIYTDNGTLEEDRTVTMNGKNLIFDTQDHVAGGRVYIGNHANDSSMTPANGFALTTGDYRLYVEGGILTEKVKVAMRNTSNWADYVFSEGYQLKPLSEVAAFIEENKHLPGVASAEELKNNGLDLGAMQAKQMEKIEELTLYAIEQDKVIEGQKKALEKQAADIEELKAQVKLLLERK